MGNNCCIESENKYIAKDKEPFLLSKDPIFRKHQLSKKN